jgi:hypothetical protein
VSWSDALPVWALFSPLQRRLAAGAMAGSSAITDTAIIRHCNHSTLQSLPPQRVVDERRGSVLNALLMPRAHQKQKVWYVRDEDTDVWRRA